MSDAEIGASARRALADMDPHEAARVAYQAMRENDLPRAVDVIRLGGPALVVIKVPEGRIMLNGGEETSCATLAKLIASPVSRIPGVTVMVVPLAWSVEVHAVPAGSIAVPVRPATDSV